MLIERSKTHRRAKKQFLQKKFSAPFSLPLKTLVTDTAAIEIAITPATIGIPLNFPFQINLGSTIIFRRLFHLRALASNKKRSKALFEWALDLLLLIKLLSIFKPPGILQLLL